jgi:hypothetical protein
MHIFKCFENQSDTYHDTQTHYLMEQDPFLLKDQVDVMDVVVADKVEALNLGSPLSQMVGQMSTIVPLSIFWFLVQKELCS